jgi:hypothetical protein
MKDEPRPEGQVDRDNDAWFEAHFVELVQEYPRQWIAVLNVEVIGRGMTKDDAKADARSRAGGRPVSLYFVPETPLPS